MSALAGMLGTFIIGMIGANEPLCRLISASVGTVVYYGFQCYPHVGQTFLICCLLTGIAGNVFPFMDWFNRREYKVRFISIGR